MSTSLRINLENEFSAEVHDSDGDILDCVVLNTSYLLFFDSCEHLILQYGCERVDSIWIDEFEACLSTFSDENKHHNLWGLIQNA